MYKNGSSKKFEKQILKTHSLLTFLDILSISTDKTDHQILHLSIVHTI